MFDRNSVCLANAKIGKCQRYNEKDIFPELISLNCKSKLRIGFYKANHKINDIILGITPDETDLFINESKNYLNTFLK